jgi:hypothetical protein
MIAADTFGRILGVKTAAFASIPALAEKRLVAFNFQHMSPLHFYSAFAIAGLGADRVAVALRPTIAGVENVMSFVLAVGCGRWLVGSRPGVSGKQQRDTETKQQYTKILHDDNLPS